ncbi:DUF305 domain-containing protein [Bosea robiniae]|uniref:DUF305 domain-containing protein n=1 Tax=Bosea robiniae TaxID=1036780 RepID=UPI000B838366|nr:DUF305 domain-containing protein [Bosea robiniae]
MRFSLDTMLARVAGGAVPVHDHSNHGGAMPPSPDKTTAAAAAAPKGYDTYLSDMHVGMEKMMRDMHADPPSGDPDIDFLAMMVPHHWGAVEMARLVLRDGRDPIVREIAEAILAGQQTEMQGMRGRLEALRRGDDDYPSLSGNRGP